MGILGETLVHLLDTVLYQGIDLGMCRKFLITGIGHIITLGPVTHGIKIDVNKSGYKIPLIPKGDDFFNFGEELQFVLQKLWRKHAVVGQFADILGAVDDAEVTFIIEVPGIAGMHPVIRGLGFSGCLRILEVLLKHPRAAVNDFAVVFDPYLNARRGRTHTFRAH